MWFLFGVFALFEWRSRSVEQKPPEPLAIVRWLSTRWLLAGALVASGMGNLSGRVGVIVLGVVQVGFVVAWVAVVVKGRRSLREQLAFVVVAAALLMAFSSGLASELLADAWEGRP